MTVQRPAERQSAVFKLLFRGTNQGAAERASGKANGGRARMAQMTPEQRKEFARKGAQTRWTAV